MTVDKMASEGIGGSWFGLRRPKSPLRWAALLGATAIALYLCWQILRPFVDVIAWSVVLVISFYPVHRRLLRRLRSPSLAALLSTVLVVMTILIPVLLLAGMAFAEAMDLREALQSKFKDGFDPAQIQPLARVMELADRYLRLNAAKVVETIKQHGSELAQAAAKYSFVLAGNITSMVVSFVFTLFTTFLLFRDGERLAGKIPDLLPLERSQSEDLINRIREVIGASIYGVLVIALIQGAMGGILFSVLGVPSPVLWGFAMAVASMIPLMGAAAVWAPAAVYLVISGHWAKAIILAAVGGLVISSVDNFLRPKLVAGKVRLSELVMFFSVLGGLQLFGVVGIIAGPVVFAVAGSLLTTLQQSEKSAEYREPSLPGSGN